MTNIADTTRDIFQVSNNYIGSVLQQGQVVYDWMYNSDIREMSHLILNSLSGITGGVIATTDGLSIAVEPLIVPGNDVTITSGSAFVNGRFIEFDADFQYSDEEVNYIAQGEVSTVVEIVAGTTYRISDSEKLWTTNHALPGCRITFTSGVLDGDSFTIVSLIGQSINVSGDLSGLVVGDTYIISPPAITTPTSTSVKALKLVTWIEDVSENEDTNLTDPVFQDSPIHKRQLRWCVYFDWNGTESTDPTTGFSALTLCNIARSSGDASIDSDNIVSNAVYMYDLVSATEAITAVTATATDLVDRAEIQTLHDYKMSRTAPLFFSIEDDEITFSDSVFSTFNMLGKDTQKHQSELTGDVLTNTTTAQSLFVLTPNGELFGDDEVSLVQTASVNIDKDSLCVLGIVADTGSPYNVLRANAFGEQTWSRGFDWYFSYDPSTQCTVYPGEFYRWGQLYQLADQYTFDYTNGVNWEGGAVPSSGTFQWVFLYVKKSASNRRSLTAFLSETAPKWNGEHMTQQAQCIGTVYWNRITPTNPQWRVGSKIYYKQAFLREDNAGIGLTDISSLLPVCTSELTFVGRNPTCTADTFWIVNARQSSSTTDQTFTKGYIADSSLVDVKLTVPRLNVIEYVLTNGGGDSCSLYLDSVSWNDLHTPNQLNWR